MSAVIFGYSNEKGGVGKSSTIMLIAGYIQYILGKKILVIDADPQRTISEKREDDEVEFEQAADANYLVMEVTPDMVPDIIEDEKDNFDYIAVDLSGTLTTKGNIRAYSTLDKIVIPTSTSFADIKATTRFFNLMHEHIVPIKKKEEGKGIDIIVQLTKVNPRLTEYKDLRNTINSLGREIDKQIVINRNGDIADDYIHPFHILDADIKTADGKFGQDLNTSVNERNLEVLEKYQPQCEKVLEFLNA